MKGVSTMLRPQGSEPTTSATNRLLASICLSRICATGMAARSFTLQAKSPTSRKMKSASRPPAV